MAPEQNEALEYKAPPELAGGEATRVPVIVVGAGPIGLATAIDLALHGVACVLLDDNNVVSVGSRAICWAKRSLEIFDRLGVAGRMVEKGVTWKVGRVFRGERELYSFDLLPQKGHRFPAFINLQQYHVERYLIERCAAFADLIDLRFRNRVVEVAQDASGVSATIETPDGRYTLQGDYLVACDGAGSTVRGQLGLELKGQDFHERFLIADIEMEADFPAERLFWFMPAFHKGQSALLHKQPDNIYRIDLQLGADADPQREKKPENVIPRIKKVVGSRPFKLDWVSVYSFDCARMERFVHDRVIFAGDAAHVVSPFGARGGNGGIHDVDNLCWKLALVVKGEAHSALLETYNTERVHGARENIRNSAWTSRFMSPGDGAERAFRDAALGLAGRARFARSFVNAGRLSVPCGLETSPLSGPDESADEVPVRTGMAAMDAPVTAPDGGRWLLGLLGGRFVLLLCGDDIADGDGLPAGIDVIRIGAGGTSDADGMVRARYGTAAYLVRPDQHIAACWQRPPTSRDIAAAMKPFGLAGATLAQTGGPEARKRQQGRA